VLLYQACQFREVLFAKTQGVCFWGDGFLVRVPSKGCMIGFCYLMIVEDRINSFSRRTRTVDKWRSSQDPGEPRLTHKLECGLNILQQNSAAFLGSWYQEFCVDF
jgi:hypothetical protein